MNEIRHAFNVFNMLTIFNNTYLIDYNILSIITD